MQTAGMLSLISSTSMLLAGASVAIAGAGLIALALACVYRSHVANTKPRALVLFAALLIAALPVVVVVLGLFERGAALAIVALTPAGHPPVIPALVIMYLGIAFLVLRAADANELDDAWYPYLLAFGLGSHIDQWFRAFAADSHVSTSGTAIATGSRSTRSSWSGGGRAVWRWRRLWWWRRRAQLGSGRDYCGGRSVVTKVEQW